MMKRVATLTAIAFVATLLIAPPPTMAADDGAALFKTKCASCHGQDGSGNTAIGKKLQIRDLRSPAVQKMTDAEMSEMIALGGKDRKPSHAYKNKGLSEEQIKSLVVFVRSVAAK